MRPTFRPDQEGAVRSAMWGIGQARRRGWCGAKIDATGRLMTHLILIVGTKA
jgi:hypothetical protein